MTAGCYAHSFVVSPTLTICELFSARVEAQNPSLIFRQRERLGRGGGFGS